MERPIFSLPSELTIISAYNSFYPARVLFGTVRLETYVFFRVFSPFPRPPSPEVFQALFNTRVFSGFCFWTHFRSWLCVSSGFCLFFSVVCTVFLHSYFCLVLVAFLSRLFRTLFFRVLAFGHFFWIFLVFFHVTAGSDQPVPAQGSPGSAEDV